MNTTGTIGEGSNHPKTTQVFSIINGHGRRIQKILQIQTSADFGMFEWSITPEGLIRSTQGGTHMTARGAPGIEEVAHIQDVHIDGKTIRKLAEIEGAIIFADKNFIYFVRGGYSHSRSIPEIFVIGSEPHAFRAFGADVEKLIGYYTDGLRIFSSVGSMILSEDVANFVIIGDGFAKDNKHLYQNGYPVLSTEEGIDIGSASKLSEHYYTDNTGGVFYKDPYPSEGNGGLIPLPEGVDAKKFVWVSSLESSGQIHATYTSLHTDGKNDYVCQFPVVYSCEKDGRIVRVTQTIHHGTRKTLVPLHDIARLLASGIVTQDMVKNDPKVIQYKRELEDKIMGLQAQLDAAMGEQAIFGT